MTSTPLSLLAPLWPSLLASALAACTPVSNDLDDTDPSSTTTQTQGASTSGSSGVDDSTGETDTDTNADTGTALPPVELVWGECPDGFVSECAHVDVPLDGSQPQGETISVLVARRPAPVQPAQTQLWLVMGGPGDSADVFAEQGLVGALGLLNPNTDVYVMEHRGVGESTRLGCNPPLVPDDPWRIGVSPEAMATCRRAIEDQWGDDLQHMSARGAAHDIEAVIDATLGDDQQLVLYGVSYGTLLVQRYLQLFPGRADAVILDSLYGPGAQYMDDYDGQWDVVAQVLADRCAEDPTCAGAFGADPWERVVQIVDDFEAGHCPLADLGPDDLGPLAFHVLDSVALREHLLALLHRIDRCSPADVAAVEHYLTTLAALLGPPSPRRSDVLTTHIVLSEEWRTPAPPVAEVQQRCEDAVLCPEVASSHAWHQPDWPIYDEPFTDQWPTFDQPVLVLQGQLDAKTPLATARTIEPHLRGDHQHFVEVPDASHVVIASTPTTDGSPLPCGLLIMAGFVADPTGPLDLACLDHLVPLDFTGDPTTNATFFGTEDRWD